MSDNGQVPVSIQDDDELAIRVANGDVAAFGLLYDRYGPAVYAIAAHTLGASDAEEVVQDVFLQLWLKAGQFEPSRGSFKAWFMAVARNRVIHELRLRTRQQRARAAESIDHVLARMADTSLDPERHVWLSDQAKALAIELGILPVDQRRVLVLAYFGGMSQAAIAEHLDIPLGTVKKRTRLGMVKLRRAFVHANTGEFEGGDASSPAMKARKTDGL